MYNLFQEFIRYVLVGGTAFIIDMSLLLTFSNYVFYNLLETGVYISAALGFLGGSLYNYYLSLIFVFKSAKEHNKGKTFSAFITFVLIGAVGLILTEVGMYVGIHIFETNYILSKILVAGCILIWNYGIRKILIF